jgi:serine/threonine protein kinase
VPTWRRKSTATVFCGIFSYLWSTNFILYNLLTNRILYYLPVPADISFCYNILARGLSSTPIGNRTMLTLKEANQGQHHHLFRRAIAHMNLSPEATELLEHLLAFSPYERWTLAQAMELAYVQANEQG